MPAGRIGTGCSPANGLSQTLRASRLIAYLVARIAEGRLAAFADIPWPRTNGYYRPGAAVHLRLPPKRVSSMNRHEFDNLALTATDDVVAFAKFVQRTEFLFAGSSDADSLKCYQGAWFEVEIVNAAALAAWGMTADL